MSDKEIQRLAVLQDVRDHRITQVRAAEILNLSTRQITRLLQKLNQDGVSAMAHASRGQAGHHRHDELVKSAIPGFLKSSDSSASILFLINCMVSDPL